MTPTTTSTSIRDYLIDCAIRWQRRNKLIVPRAGAIVAAQADDQPVVPAVIGPRHADLKASLPPLAEVAAAMAAAPEAPAAVAPALEQLAVVIEAPVEQTVVVPEAPAPGPAPIAVEALAAEPELDAHEEAAAEPEVAPALEAVEPVVAPEAEAPEAEELPAAPVAETVAPEAEPAPPVAIAAEVSVPAAPALTLSADAITWQALILSGPAGSGKSSIAQQFCEMLPQSVHLKVEPLRDRAYSVLVAQPVNHAGSEEAARPEVWSGKTDEARQQASDLARAYAHQGYCVVIDDVIESPADLKVYQESLTELEARTITLMPSLEEMERRDKMRPVEQQAGLRIREVHTAMTRELGQHSTVLDTSQETVQETVERILQLLA